MSRLNIVSLYLYCKHNLDDVIVDSTIGMNYILA